MVDLGCQEMSGNVKDVLGAILLLDGFILVTLSMDQEKYFRLIFGPEGVP